MRQIAEWLEKLGMSEYASRFAENDIDTSILRDLTDQDLKELGVLLGHRRKMLRAIAELVAVPPTHLHPALTEPMPQVLRSVDCDLGGLARDRQRIRVLDLYPAVGAPRQI